MQCRSPCQLLERDKHARSQPQQSTARWVAAWLQACGQQTVRRERADAAARAMAL